MWYRLRRILVGRPLSNEELEHEKMSVPWGLSILASDAISSVAYAGEEILWVLIPLLGIASYKNMFFVALAIVALLWLLVFSYKQTIEHYPSGGGAYIVAKENLGTKYGLIAGASLLVDYTLTVAVSASAASAAVVSAVPQIIHYKMEIAIVIIVFLTIGNLRGLRESARVFGIPTYIFLGSTLFMVGFGLFKVYILGYEPTAMYTIPAAAGDVSLFLMLRAFASGCTALTGVEAVSNAVPNFTDPPQKNATKVLVLLALVVMVLFGGTSYLATLYHAVPTESSTVISQIAFQVFDGGILYYILQIATMMILAMAANTAFNGLPLLLSLIAKDGYMPKQFTKRGDRLGYSNGIKMLAVVSIALIFLFRGETHALLPLYAVGVFISFTLSQSGMFMKIWHSQEKNKFYKLMINGLGAIVTFITSFVIAISKFQAGAWIVLIVIPLVVYWMRYTKRHYLGLSHKLKLMPDKVEEESELIEVKKYAIVLIDSLNKASLKAISYASDVFTPYYVIAFHVATSQEDEADIRRKWAECGLEIPLIVEYSPYREVIEPLVKYLADAEQLSKSCEVLTVVMSEFVFENEFDNIYHNQTASAIRKNLLRDRHISVITVPYVLE